MTSTRSGGSKNVLYQTRKGVSLLAKTDNLYFFKEYRKKKNRQRKIRSLEDAVYQSYMDKITDSLYAVQETEALFWEIEKKHRPDILKDVWNSLPEEEQKELLYMLDALRKKVSWIKEKTTSFEKRNRPL